MVCRRKVNKGESKEYKEKGVKTRWKVREGQEEA
jgi:hypothetical protein